MRHIKVSIIIPVLNSKEVVRRQLLHFDRMELPDDVELILVDDGSDPPLDVPAKITSIVTPASRSMSVSDSPFSFRLTVHQTNDTRPWTWALARNEGARLAKGQYLLMTDIDHILSRELIEDARTFGEQKLHFKREFGILDEDGRFSQDMDVLMSYGLKASQFKRNGLRIGPLPNNFCMRADVFWELGGYVEHLVERAYPQGEDRRWKKSWCQWEAAGKGHVSVTHPTIYMFPNGKYCGDVDYNPFGLFHDLTRKTRRNMWHKKLMEAKK